MAFELQEKLLGSQKLDKVVSQPNFYTHLVAELEAIGWEKWVVAYQSYSFDKHGEHNVLICLLAG